MKLCITGANSSVGRNLLRHVAQDSSINALALVRSAAAIAALPKAANIEAQAAGYADSAALAAAFRGADSVIHLAGVLFEGNNSTYRQANVDSTAAVVRAAQEAGVRHLLFISVLGATPQSKNPYYRTKGEAEVLVTASGLTATVLRTPLLLGPDSAGGQALVREAGSGRAKLLGGGHQQVRPLDVDDLAAAIVAACRAPQPGTRTLELCGPESVSYHTLVRRMAACIGREVQITAIPVWLASLAAGLGHAIKGGGMSPAIIAVITSAETVKQNADRELGLGLTPLAQTLAKLAGKEISDG
jgi:uncharacterized protein YbjT (DUF2867 family)